MFRKKIKLDSCSGFTLAELMIAALVLVTVLVGLLASYVACLDLNETNSNMTLALNAAQEKLAEIRDYSFSNICTDFNNTTFNLDGIMPTGESMAMIYTYVDSDFNSCSTYNCSCDYDVIRVVISVCWRQKSGRVIGEDKDLDGIIDTDEDVNNNGQIDSPAQIVTFLTAE
ncbi:MAG: hypothetical protein KJ593_03940 [Candidatus Omnitrophica bacterium]|nr:hypothetical protein [Candidatus Omnitrophota bacterium]